MTKTDSEIIDDTEQMTKMLDVNFSIFQASSNLEFMGKTWHGVLIEPGEEVTSEEIRKIQSFLRLAGYSPVLNEYDGNLRILGLLEESD